MCVYSSCTIHEVMGDAILEIRSFDIGQFDTSVYCIKFMSDHSNIFPISLLALPFISIYRGCNRYNPSHINIRPLAGRLHDVPISSSGRLEDHVQL